MGNRIVVIDDDISTLEIVDLLLEGAGFEVERHVDGAAAIVSVFQREPDVVVIDLMMPRISGQECVSRLRAQGVRVPILAFTALDDPEVHQQAFAAGCTKVLLKPCKSKDLIKEIESLIITREITMYRS
jgi:CheY-like chemotaxis protein